jgi:hypothetical protein
MEKLKTNGKGRNEYKHETLRAFFARGVDKNKASDCGW